MHPLSLAALTVLELPPDEQIACAHACGYQGVGLRLIPATPQEKHYTLLNDSSRLRKVKQLLADTPIKIFDIEIFRLKEDTDIESYLPYLELGASLGATSMLVAGNDPDRVRLQDQWGKLCALSKPFNIKPHMEPMPWTDVKSYGDGVRLVEQGPEWGAVLIDPIHFFRAGGNVAHIKQEHVARMRYLQFTDAPVEQPETMDEILRQAREDRFPPGTGGLPLKTLLERISPELPISLEIPLAPRWGCVSAEEKAVFVYQKTKLFLEGLGR